MNRLVLMRNPELFQGEKNLTKNKKYFEGWYFKNTNGEEGISFIPGINIEGKNKKAFIQVITNNASYFVNYGINEFKFNDSPFSIEIGNNYFSKEKINIDIKDEKQNLNINGTIDYSNSKNINTDFLNPNIMGPFSYVPFMECNHAILNMQNKASGAININGTNLKFENGTGYIEKDWGNSFPKTYAWCQGNNFQNSNASFMFSMADIPFKVFNFRGIICVLKIDDEEFKFTTYNNAKLLNYDIKDNELDITLKRGIYELNIKSICEESQKLAAPSKGKMDREILESIGANIEVTLKKNNKIIFADKSKNCGLEMA